MRADHGSDVAAIQYRPRRIGGELTLKIDQRLPHFGDRRYHGGGLAHYLRLQGGMSELFGIEFQSGSDRARLVGEIGAGVQQRLGHRAVDHAGIEVTIAVMRRQALAERALA